MSDLEQRRARRFLVLQAAYKLSDGNPEKEFLQEDVEKGLGLSQPEIDELILYLKIEGLVTLHSLGRVYRLTQVGVTEYRTAISQPDAPTRYFPPVGGIRIERKGRPHVRHTPAVSRVPETSQKNGRHQPQTAARARVAPPAIKGFDAAAVEALVRDIRAVNPALSPIDRATLDSDLATVDAQLKRPRPLRSIIAESLGSARAIVEAAGARLLAGKIAKLLLEMAAWDF